MKAFGDIEYNAIQNVIFSKKQHEFASNVRKYKISLLCNLGLVFT